jgi:sulfur-oxidizing protein SoxY
MKGAAARPPNRRQVIALGVGGVMLSALPEPVGATQDEVSAAIAKLFGSGAIIDGRVMLEIPKLAETGFSVPVSVSVESPMTEADHVSRIAIFSEQNPRPRIVEAFFSPASGEASLETRIRLSGSQGVVAIAQMSDGSLWRARQEIEVIVGACKPPPARR